MDVNSLNKNYEYLNRNTNTKTNIDVSQYLSSTINSEKVQKVSMLTKINKSEEGIDGKKEEEISEDELDFAVKKLNKFLEDEKTHAEYEKHEDLGTMMVRIVNDETEKVIVELPPKKVLDMIASICKQVGILDKKA